RRRRLCRRLERDRAQPTGQATRTWPTCPLAATRETTQPPSARSRMRRGPGVPTMEPDTAPKGDETMKKILIATDGSLPSTEALEFGLDLAGEEDADTIVVHVVPSIDSVPSGGFGMPNGAIVHEVTAEDMAPLDAAVELAAEK